MQVLSGSVPHLSALLMLWVILYDGFIVLYKVRHQHYNHKYFSELSDTLRPEWQQYKVGVMWIEMGAILLVQELYCFSYKMLIVTSNR